MNQKSEFLTVDRETVPKEKNPTALVPIGERGIMLRSLEDLYRFARMAVAGGAAPRAMTEGQAAVAIQAGLERGLGPLGGLTQCVVINGVLSWRGQAAIALIQNSGLVKPGTLDFGIEGKGDSRKGFAVAHRVGYAQPTRREFSIDDAKQARLWGGKSEGWIKYPDRMLAWRALGFLARDVFPDVLGGFPLAEEAIDFEDGKPQRSPEGAKPPEVAPPSTPDPLLDAIEAKGKTTWAQFEAEHPGVHVEQTIDVEPETDKPDPAPIVDETPLESSDEPQQPEADEPRLDAGLAPPTCQHGALGSDFCPECSLESDRGIAAKDTQ